MERRLNKYHFSKITRYFLILLFLSASLFLFFAFIIYNFPIQTSFLNFDTIKLESFFSPWPVSPLDQEIMERKRLKRYSKSDRTKRLEKQLQKMNLLSVPIYDLTLDNKLDFSYLSSNAYPEKNSYIWPILPRNNSFSSDLNSQLLKSQLQKTGYKHGTLLEEIIYRTGDFAAVDPPLVAQCFFTGDYQFHYSLRQRTRHRRLRRVLHRHRRHQHARPPPARTTVG